MTVSDHRLRLWEITYTITPERGYFDHGEAVLWDHGIYFETIQAMEFLDDGSVVITYEVDGSVDQLCEHLEAATEKVIEYAVTAARESLVLQVWFHPDDTLERTLDAQKSVGSSISFPATYLDHDPATVELTETGSRDVLRERIEQTRATADVRIEQIHEYSHGTGRLFQNLTTRQQEVVRTAVDLGYYESPRRATHEDIADALGCSKSVVGQHLRHVERSIITTVVPRRNTGAV